MRLHVYIKPDLLHVFIILCLAPEYIICLPVQCTGRIKIMYVVILTFELLEAADILFLLAVNRIRLLN